MDISKVKIKLEGGLMPKKQSKYAAAYDLYCPEDVNILLSRQVVDLKFSMEMPHNLKADIRPRSGYSVNGFELCYKSLIGEVKKVRADIDVILGTIDADYRNHVGVILQVRHIPQPDYINGFCYIPQGERIAQMVFSEVPPTELVEVDELDMTDDRGGGFGHTNDK